MSSWFESLIHWAAARAPALDGGLVEPGESFPKLVLVATFNQASPAERGPSGGFRPAIGRRAAGARSRGVLSAMMATGILSATVRWPQHRGSKGSGGAKGQAIVIGAGSATAGQPTTATARDRPASSGDGRRAAAVLAGRAARARSPIAACTSDGPAGGDGYFWIPGISRREAHWLAHGKGPVGTGAGKFRTAAVFAAHEAD